MWGGDVLGCELDPRTGGTLLTFTHTFDDKAGAAHDVSSGWDICFASLKAGLAGPPDLGPSRPNAVRPCSRTMRGDLALRLPCTRDQTCDGTGALRGHSAGRGVTVTMMFL